MAVAKPQIDLFPWDPDSPEHVKRLYQQRIACGWNKDLVEGWRESQRAGKIALHWVVFSESEPSITHKLAIHTSTWPAECESISDTATSLGGKPRVPNTSRTFIPVGHISLDSENEDPSLADGKNGIYRISTFYVSTVLQGGGLGRSSMDVVESLAASEPLNARTLTLATVANDYVGRKAKWDTLKMEGREEPKMSTQDWYTRRGYEPYKNVDKMWSETDSQGRLWWTTAVFMRKDIK